MNMTVTVTNWLMAFLPLLFLLALMLGRKWGVAEAGSVAWLAAAATAWFFFDTPAEVIGYETVKGTWNNWLLVSFAFVYVFALFTIFQALVMFKGK